MSKLSLSDKAGVLAVAETVKYFLTFALGICLVRLFSKDIYGTYQQAFLVVWSLISLLSCGIPASVYYFLPQLIQRDKSKLIKQSVISLLFIGTIAYIGIYFSSRIISIKFNNPDLGILLKIFSLYIIPALTLGLVGPILISLDKANIYAFYNIITNFILTMFILLLSFLHYDLEFIITIIVVIGFGNFIFSLWYLNKLIKFSWEGWDLLLLRRQIKYALPLGFSGMAGNLGKQVDKWLISLFFLPAQFAVYNVGAIEIPIITFITGSVDSVILPKFVEFFKNNQTQKVLELWNESIRKTTLIIMPIFVFCLVFANQIITVLYTNDYGGAVNIFRIYLLILPLRLARFSLILQALGKSKLVLVGALAFLLLNISLNIFFIKIVGFTGPAWSTFVSLILLIIFYIANVKVNLKLRFFELYPIKKIINISTCALISGIIVYPIQLFPFPKLVIIVLGLIAYFALYIITLSITKMLHQGDFYFVKRWVKLKILVAS